MPRLRFRLPLLMALLMVSVLWMLHDPIEDVVIEAYWAPVELPPVAKRCGAVPAARCAWTLSVGGGDGEFPGLREATLRPLQPRCARGCDARNTVEIRPVWRARADFFGGYSAAHVEVGVHRRLGDCAARSRFRLDISIDQGRRGTRSVAIAHLGRVLGSFIQDRWTPAQAKLALGR